MFSKSNVLGTLSGFIILFFLGFLYYDILANDFMMEASNQAISKIPADMFYLSLGLLIQAFSMSTLYQKLTGKDANLSSGFKFGAWIGVLVGFGMGFVWYGTADIYTLNGHLVDAVWSVVFYGIVGAAIGWTQQKMN